MVLMCIPVNSLKTPSTEFLQLPVTASSQVGHKLHLDDGFVGGQEKDMSGICLAESRLCREAECISYFCIKQIQHFILSGGAVDKLLKLWKYSRDREAWLKSPDISTNALGCCVYSLAIAQLSMSHVALAPADSRM